MARSTGRSDPHVTAGAQEGTDPAAGLVAKRVTNLDDAGRKRRFRLGILAGAAGLVLAIAIYAAEGSSRSPARVLTLPFFYAALAGVLQARAGTCMARARRGEREEAGCAIKIDDAEQAAALRRTARRIRWQAAAGALGATFVFLALPAWPGG
jgi:hypothetical protein